jgi:glutamyl-tRNA reductase
VTLPLADSLLLVGISHHTAPVALRERLAFRRDDMPRALTGILARGFHEAIILSTCNRVEVVSVAQSETGDPAAQVRAFLAEHHQVAEKEFTGALYQFNGCEAARHIFEVASSLDSQILGETEILSQSREAYRVAAEHGACGPLLRGIYERSFFLAKELRSEGGIGRVQASVSSAAVSLANKVFEVKGRKVLLLGTGEMATGIVRALRAAGVGELWVASRTPERASEFANREGGRSCRMQDISEQLVLADIVLVSSAAPHYIVSPEQVKAAFAKRRGRSLCVIDISVPRNVDPAVAEIKEDVFLFDIDDLEDVARDGRREREAVAARWRPRLAEEARAVLRELQEQGTRETARKLIEHANDTREQILDAARSDGLDPKVLAKLERALERLQGRILHGPLETLKEASREGDGADAAAWVSRLFRLEALEPEEKEKKEPNKEQEQHGAVEPLQADSPVPKSSNELLRKAQAARQAEVPPLKAGETPSLQSGL